MTDRNVLIIGGGVAGITAALELAEMGINSTVVEKENHIGGQASVFPGVVALAHPCWD